MGDGLEGAQGNAQVAGQDGRHWQHSHTLYHVRTGKRRAGRFGKCFCDLLVGERDGPWVGEPGIVSQSATVSPAAGPPPRRRAAPTGRCPRSSGPRSARAIRPAHAAPRPRPARTSTGWKRRGWTVAVPDRRDCKGRMSQRQKAQANSASRPAPSTRCRQPARAATAMVTGIAATRPRIRPEPDRRASACSAQACISAPRRWGLWPARG
jgi:hypothetical protein